MTFNACVEEPIDPGTGVIVNFPESNLADEPGFLSFDSTISAGESFMVKVNATKGDTPLKVFYVKEEGIDLSTDRFMVNGETPASNPILLFAPDTEGFTWDITVQGHDSGVAEYSFIVEDDAGETTTQRLSITAEGTPPVVSIEGSGMPSADAGQLVTIPITVGQGSFLLTSIAVYENDELISDLDRLRYADSNNAFDANPYIIPTADQGGFAGNIFIRASDEAGTTNMYRVDIADEFGNVTSESFTITTNQSGTAITTLQGILFNRAGPVGTGGLDLDTGNGTGSSDALAEIRDEGIDAGQPNDVNWIKNISGVNGTELKLIIANSANVSENFSFDGVTFAEQIDEFDNPDVGTPFQNTNSDGQLVSWLVEVGDVFFAKGTSNNYLFIVREVNETPGDNGDNYVLDIKY